MKEYKKWALYILPSDSYYLQNNMNMDDDIRIEKNANGLDTYIFDPYNPLNKVISENDIRNMLSNYGINAPIYNTKLYERAFVHRSYTKRP